MINFAVVGFERIVLTICTDVCVCTVDDHCIVYVSYFKRKHIPDRNLTTRSKNAQPNTHIHTLSNAQIERYKEIMEPNGNGIIGIGSAPAVLCIWALTDCIWTVPPSQQHSSSFPIQFKATCLSLSTNIINNGNINSSGSAAPAFHLRACAVRYSIILFHSNFFSL